MAVPAIVQFEEELLLSISVYNYRVDVYTGDVPEAETNARVYVILVGKRGDTGKRWLLKQNQHTCFRRGKVGVLWSDMNIQLV